MNDIREIVTKAVVGKGRKTTRLNEKIALQNDAFSILGCWIINHNFDAKKVDDNVLVNGSFEVNVWYSSSNNSKTDVLRNRVEYSDKITVNQIVSDYLENSDDIIVKIIKQPTCTDAKIINNTIETDIVFELSAEVIGETKMRVSIFNQDSVENEIDESINIDFIQTDSV